VSGKKKIIATTVVLVIAGLIVSFWNIGSRKVENTDKIPMVETENCSTHIEESETIGTEVDTVSGTETDINVIDPDSVIKAMVYMESGAAGGNGSIYEMTEDEVIIVTTYHLLQNAEKVNVRFYDNMYAEASVIGINEKHDVGFVSIPVDEVPVDTLKRIKAIQRNDYKSRKGKQITFGIRLSKKTYKLQNYAKKCEINLKKVLHSLFSCVII
jgi:serine protease Do